MRPQTGKQKSPGLRTDAKTAETGADEYCSDGLTPKTIFKGAILYFSKKSTLNVVKQILSDDIGCQNLQTPEDPGSCLKLMEERPHSCLLIDWKQSPEITVRLLKAARNEGSNSRPVIVSVTNVTPEIVATAMEYGVNRIIAGNITSTNLKDQIEQIVKSVKSEGTILAAMKPADVDESEIAQPVDEVETLQELHEQYPGNHRITVELAERLIERENWVNAEMLLHSLWTLDPPYLRALSAYSRCLLKKGAQDDAVMVLKKGKLINPFDPDRLVELGEVLLNMGSTEEAAQNFNEALCIDPDLKPATFGKAKCKLLENDVNDALELLKEVASPRELASVFNTAAILATKEKRFEHGLSLYQVAAQTVKKEATLKARLVFNLGLAFYKSGRNEEALKCFEAGKKLDSTFLKAAHNAKALSLALNGGEKPPLAKDEIEEEPIDAVHVRL